MSSKRQEQVEALVASRRVKGAVSTMLSIEGLGVCMATFAVRYGTGYVTFVAPPFFIQELQKLMIWGTHEDVSVMEEFINGHMWFPAAFGFNRTTSTRTLEANLEAIDDRQFADLIQGLFALSGMDEKTTIVSLPASMPSKIKSMSQFIDLCVR